MIDLGMTQVQLARAVSKKTGLYVDGSLINKAINGKTHSEKLLNGINDVLGIKSFKP